MTEHTTTRHSSQRTERRSHRNTALYTHRARLLDSAAHARDTAGSAARRSDDRRTDGQTDRRATARHHPAKTPGQTQPGARQHFARATQFRDQRRDKADDSHTERMIEGDTRVEVEKSPRACPRGALETHDKIYRAPGRGRSNDTGQCPMPDAKNERTEQSRQRKLSFTPLS